MQQSSDNPDEDALAALWRVLDLLPFRVFWKDRDLVYGGANRLFRSDANVETVCDLMGATDFDLPWTQAEAEFFRACDEETMQSGEPQNDIVESQTNADGEMIWLETHKIPMQNDAGEVVGILGLYRDITEKTRAEVELKQSHDALEQSNDELENLVLARTKELQRLAQRDGLTDLANRNHFVKQLDEAIQSQLKYAVLFVDVDRFKSINDSYGHRVGDGLLLGVAKALSDSTRRDAIIGRFGGDEFTILLPALRNSEEALATAERMLAMLKNPIKVDSVELSVDASIGVVVDLENKYTSADDVIRDADLAMYDAKNKGRSQYRFFREEMLSKVRRRTEREQQMRVGIERGEFVPAFQPICRLVDDHTVTALEVLARWDHPDLGILTPYEFLDIAEETGLIRELGISIIERACDQYREWRTQGIAPEGLRLNVNLSPLQVTPELPSMLKEIVSSRGIKPEWIDLEITETLLLNQDDCADTLDHIKDAGFGLVLDDFGTGFSSLSYLHRLPIDQLKIDRSFVNSMVEDRSSREIVRTIIGLAHLLDLSVVAEGVETLEQLAMLRELDCNLVQGYLFSKPVLEVNFDFDFDFGARAGVTSP